MNRITDDARGKAGLTDADRIRLIAATAHHQRRLKIQTNRRGMLAMVLTMLCGSGRPGGGR